MLKTGPSCWPRATLASRKINHFRVLDHWYRLTLPQLRKTPEAWIRIALLKDIARALWGT